MKVVVDKDESTDGAENIGNTKLIEAAKWCVVEDEVKGYVVEEVVKGYVVEDVLEDVVPPMVDSEYEK